MGSSIAAEILYAFEKTGDAYYRLRLLDTVRWTLTAYRITMATTGGESGG